MLTLLTLVFGIPGTLMTIFGLGFIVYGVIFGILFGVIALILAITIIGLPIAFVFFVLMLASLAMAVLGIVLLLVGVVLLAIAVITGIIPGAIATLVMPIVGIVGYPIIGTIAIVVAVATTIIFDSINAGTSTLLSGVIQIPVSGGLALVRMTDFAASVLGVLLTFSSGSFVRLLSSVVAIPAYLMGQFVASLEGLFNPINSINSLGGTVYAGINAIFGEIQGLIGMVGNGLRFINTEAINSAVNLLSAVPSAIIPAGTGMAGVTHATTGVVANAWLP